jgi:hypothetical protein
MFASRSVTLLALIGCSNWLWQPPRRDNDLEPGRKCVASSGEPTGNQALVGAEGDTPNLSDVTGERRPDQGQEEVSPSLAPQTWIGLCTILPSLRTDNLTSQSKPSSSGIRAQRGDKPRSVPESPLPYPPIGRSSARRFIARPSGLSSPSGVVFGATGSLSPRPTVSSRSAATPWATR